jgi:hypothetical protein
MARQYNKRVISIRPTSIAMLQGVLGAVAGLAIAILYSMNNAVDIAESTNSVLAGLILGLASGAIAIIVVPLVYFGIGWVVGLIQGVVLNFLVETSGGIQVELSDNK